MVILLVYPEEPRVWVREDNIWLEVCLCVCVCVGIGSEQLECSARHLEASDVV